MITDHELNFSFIQETSLLNTTHVTGIASIWGHNVVDQNEIGNLGQKCHVLRNILECNTMKANHIHLLLICIHI